jgi:hypothetical protein
MKYVLVTLRSPDSVEELRSQAKGLYGVKKVGELEYDEDLNIPPYFFIYCEPDADLRMIADEMEKDDSVASAKEPPARYAM